MPEFLPRIRNDKEVQVTRKVTEITVEFTTNQIREALIDKYGLTPIGPENLRISSEAKLVTMSPGKAPRFALRWEMEPLPQIDAEYDREDPFDQD